MSISRVPYARLEALPSPKYQQADESVYSKAAWLAATGLFDADYYLAFNKDVARNGIDPVLHYVSQGWKENRNPAPWFDNSLYRQENPEVAGCPFLHYLLTGYKEGRRANKSQVRKIGRLICAMSTESGKVPEKMVGAILSGTIKPDKIIFYTRRDLFQTSAGLDALLALGLEIRFHDYPDTYAPAAPALDDFPQDVIAAWRGNEESGLQWLDNLVPVFRGNPDCVVSGVVAHVDPNKGQFLTEAPISDQPACTNIPIMESGIIFNANSICKEFFAETLAHDLAPDYADAWLWVMFLLSEKKIRPASLDTAGIWLKTRDHIKELKNVLFYFREDVSRVLGSDVRDLFLRGELIDLYRKLKNLRLDLNPPRTFNEKLNYLKIYGDQRQNTLLSDKYLARAFALERIGASYLPELYGVWDTVEAIDFKRLPDSFVLKTNHACGANIIVTNKSNLDIRDISEKMAKWLNMNYTDDCLEINYSNTNPLIMAEEYLGADLTEYKCLCLNGEPELIWADLGRFTNHTRNIYTTNWEKLDLKFAYENSPRVVPRPERLQEMLNCCRALAQGLPHVRCDFYVLGDGKLKMGELTFYSESGGSECIPESESSRLAAKISIAELPGQDSACFSETEIRK